LKSFLLLTGFPSHSLLKGDFFKDTLLISVTFLLQFHCTGCYSSFHSPCYREFFQRVPVTGCSFRESLSESFQRVPVTGCPFRELLLRGVLSESPCCRVSFQRVAVTGCSFRESLLQGVLSESPCYRVFFQRVVVTSCSFRESLLQGVLSESCCYRASFVPRMADIVGRNAITMATNMTKTGAILHRVRNLEVTARASISSSRQLTSPSNILFSV